MNPNQAVTEHIHYLHKKVNTLKLKKLSNEEIVAILNKEDAIDEPYAYTLIENIEEDRSDKKAFWKLIFASTISITAGMFVLFSPQFNKVQHGYIYWLLVWVPLAGGISFLTKALSIFKK